MREILFKAKRVDNGEWVEGFYFQDTIKNNTVIKDKTIHLMAVVEKETLTTTIKTMYYEIDPETLCECTGLKDKNGKLIFENDEIYFLDGMSTENGFDDFNNAGFVKWSEEEARFYVTDRESVSSEDALNYCTIIGNKFEEVESEN